MWRTTKPLPTTSTDTTPAATRAAVILPWERPDRDQDVRAAEARLDEAVGLTSSIGLVVVLSAVLLLRARRPATLLGSGQVESLKAAVADKGVAVVVIDARLSPGQQRNLETALGCKVIDRTGLILDIFGARAATREGTLQVELAHLEYQRSRLVRLWTHLERQRGGFGFLGGPGETQIEADRRMIGDRIVRLKRELEQVRRTRGLHRSARKRVPFPVVALVGYTNAGKSTLFNALTGASVMARDQLFATLDPTMRGIELPSGRRVILSDTVGFISELPTELIAAFRATLEEVAEADIILHVRDIAHPDSSAQRSDVHSVLTGMERDGMLDAEWRSRVIEVLNKVDLLAEPRALPYRDDIVPISAMAGDGLPELMEAIDERLTSAMVVASYRLPIHEGAAIAWLYDHGEVLERDDGEERVFITVRLRDADKSRFAVQFRSLLATMEEAPEA
ncbi:GTPase HflX [Acetobacter sacchari]|uniref:GTPase HflX n=1 Tax=Acetobacter sacchari TaxID=2661687 RepID=A0ABS3LUP9_9PROT|nr:GTPase HflX [Acetobacter sacchari]